MLLALGRVRDGRARITRGSASLLLVMFALQVYITGSVESWTVAGLVRPAPLRRDDAVARRSASRRSPSPGPASSAGAGSALVAVLVVVAVHLVELGLMAQFGLNRMDRQRLTLGDECLRRRSSVLPRDAPALVWRYLTNRASFYAAAASAVTTGIVLYFADTRFPIERANGVQTMATCHALAARGHDVTLVVRPDTTPPARDPFAFYGLPRIAGLHDCTRCRRSTGAASASARTSC